MKRFFCLFALLAASSLSALSAGFIVLHGPDHWPHPVPPPRQPVEPPRLRPPPRPAPDAPIELRQLQARVQIEDQIARTTLEHDFYNPNSRELEGTFLFPVPRGAQLDRFAMKINGQDIEAELLPADKARKIYEDIVRARKDPALMEYADRDVYKVRVFPIPAQNTQKLTVSYTQVLAADAGLIGYALPLSGQTRPGRVAVDLALKTRRPLKAVYSPSHAVEIDRTGESHARVGFETGSGQRLEDFQLLYSFEEGPLSVNLLTHRTGEEDGYFLLLLNTSLQNTRPVPKDILFVLDTSGSMAGPKLEQAKKALLFCVENLDGTDRFDIIRFSTEVEPLFGKLAEASDERRARAREFIAGLKPIGGTAIAAALGRALSSLPKEANRPSHVIFLTDGLPTVGVTDNDKIVHGLKHGGNTRVFCLGIGTDVNTHLLDRITEATRAVSQYVLPEEDLELKISSFYAKIKDPALTDPELVFPEGIQATKLYPSPLPDLFRGQQLIVAGRYRESGSGTLLLRGRTHHERQTFEYSVEFPKRSDDHAFLPRLWATRRVGFLLDEIRLRGESQELKDEATELARRYGIVTPYTAYLILEDERRREVPMTRRSLPLLEQNVQLRQEAADSYRFFALEDKGDAAVAGARSLRLLREAQAPADALSTLNLEAARPHVAPAQTAPSAAFSGAASTSPAAKRYADQLKERAGSFTDQTRFVGGRAFFQNGGQWVDTLSQNLDDRPTRKIQFGSPEYFALAAAHPEVLPWLSLGVDVTFALNDAIYSIHE